MTKGVEFTLDSAYRIARQTRRGEVTVGNVIPETSRARTLEVVPEVFREFILTEHLVASGEADGYELSWKPSTNSYDETTTDITVHDKLGRSWGIIGEKGRARLRYGSSGQMIWEVFINPGAPWYEGTLDEQLDQGSTALTTVVIDGDDQTITVHDRFLSSGEHLDSAARLGIVYDLENTRFVVTEAIC